jgi:Uma2 family endonuclease
MASVPRYTPHYHVEDYLQWEGDWELWNGFAVSTTPSPFGRHGAMLARLVTSLTNGVDRAECDASVLAGVDWIVAGDTVVRPDVSVVCGRPPQGHLEAAPAIVAEVLSASTRQRDLNHKRSLYENQRVPWYVIADPDRPSITVLRLSEHGSYQSVDVDALVTLVVCGDCEVTLDLQRCLLRF